MDCETLIAQFDRKQNGLLTADGEALELVREAHDGMLPSNWVYETTLDVLRSKVDDPAAEVFEIADSLVPCYNGELIQWFSDNPALAINADAEAEAEGMSSGGIMERLTMAYYIAVARVAGIVEDYISS